MALGNNEPIKRTTFLNIKDGKVYAKNPNGSLSAYGFVEGVITSIAVKDRRTNAGAPFKDWAIEMNDPDTGDEYTLCISYRSGVMVSLIMSLASDLEHVGERVRIEPYMKGQYTNIAVYLDGIKLDWLTRDLPPVEYQEVAGQRIRNDAARMQFLHEWVNRINEHLKQQ